MLLTIAIPTYNRDKKLKSQLDNVCMQLDKLQREDICILIQDNCSNDQTESICEEYVSLYSGLDIAYYRNDANLGFDKNVNLCMIKSKSKYTWVLSDDDDLSCNAIFTVVSKIDKYIGQFNFAFINYSVKSSEGFSKIECPKIKTKIIDGAELLYDIGLAHSFISSCIFEVKAWLNIDVTTYFGSLWIHLLVSRDIILNGSTLLVSEPVITMNMPSLEKSRDPIVYDDKLEFYTDAHIRFSEFCNDLENYGYSRELKKYLVSKCREYDKFQIINYKLTVEKNSLKAQLDLAKAYFSIKESFLVFVFLLLPLIFMPRQVFKVLKWLKYVVKR